VQMSDKFIQRRQHPQSALYADDNDRSGVYLETRPRGSTIGTNFHTIETTMNLHESHRRRKRSLSCPDSLHRMMDQECPDDDDEQLRIGGRGTRNSSSVPTLAIFRHYCNTHYFCSVCRVIWLRRRWIFAGLLLISFHVTMVSMAGEGVSEHSSVKEPYTLSTLDTIEGRSIFSNMDDDSQINSKLTLLRGEMTDAAVERNSRATLSDHGESQKNLQHTPVHDSIRIRGGKTVRRPSLALGKRSRTNDKPITRLGIKKGFSQPSANGSSEKRKINRAEISLIELFIIASGVLFGFHLLLCICSRME